MTKKILFGIISLLYIITNTGASIDLHRCMGKISSIDFSIAQSDPVYCGKCGMEKNESNDCCQDHLIILKISPDQCQPKSIAKTTHFDPSFTPLFYRDINTVYHAIEKRDISVQFTFHYVPPDSQAFYCCILI
ncbi:MAG: hypothetical protein JSS67_10680 [Bacteroidetes bacterium]|nr:hypothetical protein [Bacteroidota bacterium]